MAQTAKRLFLKLCPGSLQGTALSAVRRARLIRSKVEMALHPDPMPCFCPCCGARFRSFCAGDYLDSPERFNPEQYTHTRQDVLCPCCRALPRHRILALWCEAHKAFLQSASILYFAPEYSMMLWMKRSGVSCVTADLYNEADLKLDIQATGLPDDAYDVIICNHVLEHVDDFRTALREVRRVLRPGGTFICSFPMDPNVEFVDEDPAVRTEEERCRRFGQNDHKRVFGMSADRLLEESGFTVETLRGEDCPDEILPVVGPAAYDMNCLFRCEKPAQR